MVSSFSSSLACFVPLAALRAGQQQQVAPHRHHHHRLPGRGGSKGILSSPCYVPSSRDGVTVPSTTTSTTSLQNSSSDTMTDDLRLAIHEGILEVSPHASLDAWEESVQIVANVLGKDDAAAATAAAERLLADATSWSAWARAGKMARKYMQPVLMDPVKLQESLEWLQTGPLGMSDEQIVDAIRQYPKLYLVDPAEAYRKVKGVAPRKFRDSDVLKDLITNDPSVLQFQYNCDNDCIAECGFCWVTFQNRL